MDAAVLGYPALNAVRAGGAFVAFVGAGAVPLRGNRVLPVDIHRGRAALRNCRRWPRPES